MLNIDTIIRQLKKHEDERPFPYLCTAGKITIGIGRNLSDNGLRPDEVRYLFHNDLKEVMRDLDALFVSFGSMPAYVQMALIDMRFQLGPSRFRGFKRMINAIKIGAYKEASKEALDSRWAKQVPNRAKYVAKQLAGEINERMDW